MEAPWDRSGIIEKPLHGNGHSGRAQMVLRKDQASGRKEGPMRIDSRWEWRGFPLGWVEEEMLTFLWEEGLGAPAEGPQEPKVGGGGVPSLFCSDSGCLLQLRWRGERRCHKTHQVAGLDSIYYCSLLALLCSFIHSFTHLFMII